MVNVCHESDARRPASEPRGHPACKQFVVELIADNAYGNVSPRIGFERSQEFAAGDLRVFGDVEAVIIAQETGVPAACPERRTDQNNSGGVKQGRVA